MRQIVFTCDRCGAKEASPDLGAPRGWFALGAAVTAAKAAPLDKQHNRTGDVCPECTDEILNPGAKEDFSAARRAFNEIAAKRPPAPTPMPTAGDPLGDR